jgi:hypothetical protein
MNRPFGTTLISPYLVDLGVEEQNLWAIYYGANVHQSGQPTIEVGLYGKGSMEEYTGTSFTFTLNEFNLATLKMVFNAYCVGVYHGKAKNQVFR